MIVRSTAKQMASESSKALKVGLHTTVGGVDVPVFPDFSDEVTTFLANKERGPPPVVNRDLTLDDVLQTLTTGYPYVALVGEAGLGKSMIMSYVIDVLSKKKPMSDVERDFPKLAPMFGRLLDRAAEFAVRDYLILPNLRDPMNPVCISYTDPTQSANDKRIAELFCDQLGAHLDSYVEKNRKNIRRRLSRQQFKQWVDASLADLYRTVYGEITADRAFATFNHQQGLVSTTLNFGRKVSFEGKINASAQILAPTGARLSYIKLKEPAGLLRTYKNPTKSVIASGLASAYIPRVLKPQVAALSHALATTDVSDDASASTNVMSINDKHAYVVRRMNEISQQVVNKIKGGFEDESIRSPTDVVSFLGTDFSSFSPVRVLSQSSIRQFEASVNSITSSFADSAASPTFRDWITGIPAYLTEARRDVQRSLEDALMQIETIEEKERIEKEVLSRSKLTRIKPNDDDSGSPSSISDVKLALRHGASSCEITDIFSPNFFANVTSGGSYTVTDVSGTGINNLFGDVTDEKKHPPHMRLASLRRFFEGSILLFRDKFDAFVQLLADDKKNGLMERFLDYLQTGRMVVSLEGICYELEAPHILIASSNDDPFFTYRDGIVTPFDQVGLRSRIKHVRVNSALPATPEVRAGTLDVIQNALVGPNQKIFGSDRDRYISMDSQAMHVMLGDQLLGSVGTSVNLCYRDLSKRVEQLVVRTASNGRTKITLNDVVELFRRENLDENFFRYIDEERAFGGYFTDPEKATGVINGIGVSTSSRDFGVLADRHQRRSYLVGGRDTEQRPGIDVVFQLVEEPTELVGPSSRKGHQLSGDYVKRFLHQHLGTGDDTVSWENGNWVVKTECAGNWSGGDGPSASAATAVSMLSALSGREIYKNRLVTGTVSPLDEAIEAIGGTYFKGLVPTRLHEIAGELGQEQRTYFLFPPHNLADLSRLLRRDPFGMTDKVTCLPVRTIPQLYHLCTCGPIITEDDWADLDKKAETTMEEDIGKIRNNLKQYA